MCGGVAVGFEKVPRKELEQYFSQAEIAKFKEKGEAQFLYWAKEPVLPVDRDNRIKLVPWGNRTGEEGIPKTGWAKLESLDAGHWMYLHPKYIKILGSRGYEKGKWFNIESGGLKGILINKKNKERVYMITKKADASYRKITRHDRQPLEEIRNEK